MDAMVRADLIDLMARVLMEVFQAEGGIWYGQHLDPCPRDAVNGVAGLLRI